MINPNAITTPGPPCANCGKPIGDYYIVQLCDDCLEESIPEHPCHGCGKMSKHHPRATRFYDGGWKNEDGSYKPFRYYCEECSP